MNTTSVKTTKDKIKELFLSGQVLTSCGAAKDFITADLRRIITTLKREGMDIVDHWVISKGSKRYKEYFLRQFTPKSALPKAPPAPAVARVEPEVTPIEEPQSTGTPKSFIQQQIPFV